MPIHLLRNLFKKNIHMYFLLRFLMGFKKRLPSCYSGRSYGNRQHNAKNEKGRAGPVWRAEAVPHLRSCTSQVRGTSTKKIPLKISPCSTISLSGMPQAISPSVTQQLQIYFCSKPPLLFPSVCVNFQHPQHLPKPQWGEDPPLLFALSPVSCKLHLRSPGSSSLSSHR